MREVRVPKAHRGEFGLIRKACELMKVSKSGHCGYLHRRKSDARIEHEALEGFAKDILGQYHARYGYRRVTQDLRKMDIFVGDKRVLHTIQQLGYVAKGATRKHRRRKAVEPGDPRPDTVEQVFSVEGKSRLLMGDITYIPTKEGWLYPAAVIDAFSRKAVGWSMPDRITEKLAIDAIGQAIGRENPPNDGRLVFHDDQGARYTSKAFQRCLDSHGITQSISRPGTPLDNAVAESFFKTLKRELVKGRDYKTRKEATQDTFKYIELYYNTVRMHSALNYDSPVEYERRHA